VNVKFAFVKNEYPGSIIVYFTKKIEFEVVVPYVVDVVKSLGIISEL
jgi:hypothetical protein